MAEPFWRKHMAAIIIGLLDVFTVGLGMGVPFFTILFGFPVGWWVARRLPVQAADSPESAGPVSATISRSDLRALMSAGGWLAAASFVVLLVLWGPAIPKMFDPVFDAAEFGIPLILYTSMPSMIGWLALMIVISPAVQFMAVVTGGVIALAVRPRSADDAA